MVRVLAGLLIIAAWAERPVLSQSTVGCYVVTGGTQCRADSSRWGDEVNAAEFGTITPSSGYNSSQASANRRAIQAAIDYAFNNNKQVVHIPCYNNTIWIDQTLWLDNPNNHNVTISNAESHGGLIQLTVSSTSGWSTGNRVAVFGVAGTAEANGYWTTTVIDGTHVDLQKSRFVNFYGHGGVAYDPTHFGFSLKLVGCGGLGNNGLDGTAIRPAANLNAPYLVVGPGTGMAVEGLTIAGDTSGQACNAALPAQSVGIAYSGGNGGGTKFLVRDVEVTNAYKLFDLGYGQSSLADQTTLQKVVAQGGYYGVYISDGQSHINDLQDVSMLADYGVLSNGPLVNVHGGIWADGSTHADVLSISSTGKLSSGGGSYQISTTIGSPDPQIQNNCYNAFVIKTANFGPVPFTPVNYKSGTITLQILNSWYINNFGALDIASATNLEAELQTATQLYAVEKYTVFCGGVSADDIHVEGDIPMTLWDTRTCGTGQPVHLRNIKMNSDPSDTAAAPLCLGQGTACEARFLVAQTFPFLNLGNNNHTVEDVFFSQPSGTALLDPFIIDGFLQSTAEYYFKQLNLPLNMVMRWWGYSGNDDHETYSANRYMGAGHYDRDYWIMQNTLLNNGNNYARLYQYHADNISPFKGFRPEPWATPELTPNQYNQISGSLPALGTYPVIHGGTIYSVQKEGEASARKFVQSSHEFYSWGQNLTAPWSYLGGSNWVSFSKAVSSAVNNGFGLIRLTVPSTSGWSTGERIVVSGVRGATEANGHWIITVIDSRHVDLQGSKITNVYIGGGQGADTSQMFPGLAITLNLSDIGNIQFVITGVYPDLGGVTITYPGRVTAGSDVVNVNPGTKSIVYTGSTVLQEPYSWKSVTFQ